MNTGFLAGSKFFCFSLDTRRRPRTCGHTERNQKNNENKGGRPSGNIHGSRRRGNFQEVFAHRRAFGFASQYADTLCKTCSYPIVITDRDSVVAYAGLPKKEVADRKVSPDIEEIMESRKLFTRREGEHAKYPVDSLEKYEISCAMPIISEGDIIGAVMSILPEGGTGVPDDTEIKLIQTAAVFLGKQLEA